MRKSTEKKDSEARALRLQEVITNCGMTQTAFASSLDMKPNEINAIIKGRRNLTKAITTRIELKYGISSDWLLTGEGDKYAEFSPNENLKQSEQQKLIEDIEETISTLQTQLKQLKQTL